MKPNVKTVFELLFGLILALPLPVQIHAQANHTGQRQNFQAATGNVRFDHGNKALRIPVEIDNNLVLLSVSINGSKPLRFIFDTGASHTIINSRRAAELGLKTEGNANGTATGGKIEGTVIKDVSLRVGGA